MWHCVGFRFFYSAIFLVKYKGVTAYPKVINANSLLSHQTRVNGLNLLITAGQWRQKRFACAESNELALLCEVYNKVVQSLTYLKDVWVNYRYNSTHSSSRHQTGVSGRRDVTVILSPGEWATVAHSVRACVRPQGQLSCVGRLQLKCDGTRWRTGGEVMGKLANGVGSQYSSHFLETWCIQHYYRWCAHLGCQ